MNDLQLPLLIAENDAKRTKAAADFKMRVLAACLVDEQGLPFASKEADVLGLGELGSDVVEALYEAAVEVNPFGDKKKTAVEEAVKN